jgi:hypothetical protein
LGNDFAQILWFSACTLQAKLKQALTGFVKYAKLDMYCVFIEQLGGHNIISSKANG